MKKKRKLREQQATITVSDQEVFVRFANGQVFGVHIDDLDTIHTIAHVLYDDQQRKQLVLYQLEKTCDACPAQWSATDKDGNAVYIRYRWDKLTVHLYDGRPDDEVPIFSTNVGDGDGLGGSMSTEEMLKITGYIIASYAE